MSPTIGRPKGAKDGAGATQPKPFKISRATSGWRVTVGTGRATRHEDALELSILAPALATPSGNLIGFGVVTRRGDTVVITA